MTPLLEVRQISKSLGSTRALVKASLTLNAGEIHALVGENGAVKPTLMKILARVHQKEEGLLVLDGVEVDPRTSWAARSLEIRSVFQELSFCNNLTVAENFSANREMAEPHHVAQVEGLWARCISKRL